MIVATTGNEVGSSPIELQYVISDSDNAKTERNVTPFEKFYHSKVKEIEPILNLIPMLNLDRVRRHSSDKADSQFSQGRKRSAQE